jgi:light-regulated signal transduction histidine kinase (bacteriophytochrome)
VTAEETLNLPHEQLAEHAARLQETAERQEATNRDLVATNHELEAFSYTVSHDLRAPLRAIAGYSRILLEDHANDLNRQALSYLDRVVTNTTRMSQLIDDLLAFSQLRRSPLVKTATPLVDVVRSAWQELSPEDAELPVVLTIGDLPTLSVDPSLICQVFVNLLGNAVKFSAGKPHPRLDVDCGVDPQASGQPVISVRDNGIGFDSAYAAKLFDVFTRLPTEQEYEGTGIGLSIVQRIVSRHGGRAWAQATPGQGAVFSFTLGPDTLPTPATRPALAEAQA